MKTIKITGELENFTFVKEEINDSIIYELYDGDKLIHKAIDNEEEFILNGKKLEYYEIAELYMFLKCIKETDKRLIGEYKATEETELFKV